MLYPYCVDRAQGSLQSWRASWERTFYPVDLALLLEGPLSYSCKRSMMEPGSMQSFFTSRGKSLLILVGFGYLNLQFKFHLLLYSIDI